MSASRSGDPRARRHPYRHGLLAAHAQLAHAFTANVVLMTAGFVLTGYQLAGFAGRSRIMNQVPQPGIGSCRACASSTARP
jgi:hypothetical protein